MLIRLSDLLIAHIQHDGDGSYVEIAGAWRLIAGPASLQLPDHPVDHIFGDIGHPDMVAGGSGETARPRMIQHVSKDGRRYSVGEKQSDELRVPMGHERMRNLPQTVMAGKESLASEIGQPKPIGPGLHQPNFP